MVVGQDTAAIVDWSVGFSRLYADERPAPRIGVNAGPVLYRDGDYFGREINLASRVVARARGGEVLVTGQVVDEIGDVPHLAISPIGLRRAPLALSGRAGRLRACRNALSRRRGRAG
jgi:adenylate cyclase